MSSHDLKSLLDEMLTDASARFAAPRDPLPEAPSTEFEDVEQLRALGDVELRAVLAAAQRDDVLTVLSGASDGLRRRVLTNLSPDSVRWLEQNLAYFDEPTRALLAAGRGQLLRVANRLVADGSIALPRPAPEAAGDVTPDEVERLGGAIVELLALVQARGHGALRDAAGLGAEPLLEEGVALVARGASDDDLAAALDAASRRLLDAYARRLAVAREGVLALQRREDPEAFRARLARIGT